MLAQHLINLARSPVGFVYWKCGLAAGRRKQLNSFYDSFAAIATDPGRCAESQTPTHRGHSERQDSRFPNGYFQVSSSPSRTGCLRDTESLLSRPANRCCRPIAAIRTSQTKVCHAAITVVHLCRSYFTLSESKQPLGSDAGHLFERHSTSYSSLAHRESSEHTEQPHLPVR